jgi:hypothetical protein
MMKFNKKPGLIMILLAAVFTLTFGQQEPSPFDFGKMWTFENPPKEWFMKAYQYDLDQAWFDEGREAALRFSNFCSASFVSPNGLVMTNHHCAQIVVSELQQEGENFDKNGFYATTYAEERRDPTLFVEQLIKVEDVTDKMMKIISTAKTDDERLSKTQEATATLNKEYEQKPGWEKLRLQLVPFYSGAKFSMYGYKRYEDVRLVFLPEAQLGFFGGDPDNFTYPRYNLDCSFWRVYDENGQPLNTADHYFKFNTDGIKEGTPVFVIGNPGSTERYRTVAQLQYDRDYRYPVAIAFYTDRLKMLEARYAKKPDDETKVTIFELSNTLKANQGILDGLKNPDLFDRKVKMEDKIRANAKGKTYWDDMAKYYSNLGQYTSELQFLSPTPLSGGVVPLLFAIDDYMKTASANPDSPELDGLESKLKEMAVAVNDPEAQQGFSMVLGELKKYAQPNDDYLNTILDGKTPDAAAKDILAKTIFADEKDLNKLFDKSTKKVLHKKDPLISASQILSEQFHNAVAAFQTTGVARKQLSQNVAGEVFKVYGNALPPDATFTLRISDGVVKGYDYNGTEAPYKTTYYGLYDRYESNDGKFPWSLPERWKNPSMDLLKSPMDFVCTADIIGGNSGSPIINVKHEVVGLAFDGNMESLPGNFIFDEKANRTVGVHAGGIIAAMRYIYKADRLVAELTGK